MRRTLLPLLLVLCACPDEEAPTVESRDGGAAPRDGGAASDETTGEMLARVVCERQTECCPGNTRSCDTLGTILNGWLEADAVVVEPAALDTCLAAIRGVSCEVVAEYAGRPPIPRFCPGLSRGTAPIGATCAGLFDDEQCASGRCVAGACGDGLAENAACSLGECADGLACHSQVCVRPTAAGAVCENLSVCEDGYDCFRAMGEMDARCHAIVTIEPGESCENGTVCSLGDGQCWCPADMTGCARGLCGNRSRCLP